MLLSDWKMYTDSAYTCTSYDTCLKRYLAIWRAVRKRGGGVGQCVPPKSESFGPTWILKYCFLLIGTIQSYYTDMKTGFFFGFESARLQNFWPGLDPKLLLCLDPDREPGQRWLWCQKLFFTMFWHLC
jgi:hypothetical protein